PHPHDVARRRRPQRPEPEDRPPTAVEHRVGAVDKRVVSQQHVEPELEPASLARLGLPSPRGRG
ncbi:hypothetical protein RZS08_47130, partial [Arthrospira platensis SPKY1]|nr:hypothetical protein [Arthrospira platensis SPKY1]